MFNHISKYAVLALAFGSLFLQSCQPDTIEIPKEELYTREFIKQFGVFNTDQDWNSAGRVKAEVDPSLLTGAEKINVYTSWPGNSDCRIVATYPATERSFEFDYPKDNDMAYAMIKGQDGKTLYASYSKITDGQMFIGERPSRAGVKKPIPYPYDLSTNKAFGTIPVNDINRAFWEGFKVNNESISIHEPGQNETTIKYNDYTNVELKSDNNPIPESGVDLNDWKTHLEGKFPSDIVSNRIEIQIEYTTLSSNESKLKICYINSDDNWNWANLDAFGEDGVTVNNSVDEKISYTATLTDKDINNLKKYNSVLFGTNCIVYKLEFKELLPEASSQSTVNISDFINMYGLSESPQSTFEGFKGNYLKPNESYDEYGYSCADLVHLVGEGGVFSEEVNTNDNYKCNLEKYRDKLKPQDGVVYTVNENKSEVSIDYFFGCASTFNSFGYFYCSEEEADLPEAERVQLLLKKPMFLLMYEACPGANLLLKQTEDGQWVHDSGLNHSDVVIETEIGENEGKDKGPDKDTGEEWRHCMRFSNFVLNAEKGDYEGKYVPRFRSVNYRLVYYSPDQFENGKLKANAVGTYQFPQGTRIAFFVIQGGQYALDKDGGAGFKLGHRHISFSRPYMNKYIANTIKSGHSHSAGEPGYPSNMNTGNGSDEPWTPFVTYEWNGQIMMGVEDYFAETENGINGSDHDMNDMVFRVNGEFEKDREEMNDKETKKQSWLIACEDLGGTFDYDFNDVIFGVSHVAGETTATVTALAAGGTLPVYLQSDYPQIKDNATVTNEGNILIPEGSNGGEFHSWWGENHPSTSIVNATSWGGPGKSVEIQVNTDFTLTTRDDTHAKPGDTDTSMGGFRVIVKKPGEDGNTTITAPKKDGSFAAPQMFLVPNTWYWPVESQPIDGVYDGFINWSSRWWTSMLEQMQQQVIHHNWQPTYKETDKGTEQK